MATLHCTPGRELITGACYEVCPRGYERSQVNPRKCIAKCPQEWLDTGQACAKPNSDYYVGQGFAAEGKCREVCGGQCTKRPDGLWRCSCLPGYSPIGSSQCTLTCGDGTVTGTGYCSKATLTMGAPTQPTGLSALARFLIVSVVVILLSVVALILTRKRVTTSSLIEEQYGVPGKSDLVSLMRGETLVTL